MEFKAYNGVTIFVIAFLAAIICHGILAINFAMQGQYWYIAAFLGLVVFLAIHLRDAWKQIKAINQKMDVILSKSK